MQASASKESEEREEGRGGEEEEGGGGAEGGWLEVIMEGSCLWRARAGLWNL